MSILRRNRPPNPRRCKHTWNVTEAQARQSAFLRADCTRCGHAIDATALVALADHMPSMRSTLLRGFKEDA